MMNIEHIIARLFSVPTLKKLLLGRRPKIIDEAVSSLKSLGLLSNSATFAELYEVSHEYLLKNYRNEYVYKNAIANKILLGIHNLNTSYMLQEFRTGSCKVDTVVLNGTSNVYEIKSEFDTLERLHKQISAYLDVFDKVHVIVPEHQAEKIEKHLDDYVGIMELTRNTSKGTIRTYREAKSQKENVKPSVIFDSLRKEEYLSILKEHFGFEPNIPNTQIYMESKKLFCKLTPCEAHDYAVKVLKKRGNGKYIKDFIMETPYELKALALANKFSKKEMFYLNSFLSCKV